ncbi:MAG: sulfatase-like hydrolase/transferase, partial [Terracidiphilus sp.]
MNRREFMALVSSSVATGSAVTAFGATPAIEDAAAASGARGSDAHRPLNVIFLICDDLGYGDLGCYGSQLPTPNLDRLASEGMRFTRLNAGHPICSASRAALLTGRYGTRSGTTGAFGPGSKRGTSLDETLISNLFHDKGYKTKAIGKWHLGNVPPYLPTNRGFDSFYGVPYSDDFYPLPLIRDVTVLEADTDRDLLTPRYTEEAVRYVEQSGDAPYFMYLGYSY